MSTDCIQRSDGKLSAVSSQLSAKRSMSLPPSQGAYGRAASGLFSSRLLAGRVALLVGLAALPVLVGCSEANKRKWQHRTPEQNFSTALESTNGDLRREAVVRIGESSYWSSADAFHVLEAVARTDPVPQVRCIAIRVLARYTDDRPVKPLLAILTASGPGGEALPGDDDVRWETSRALVQMLGQGFLTGEQQGVACELFIRFLRSDKSRNVRIISTQVLGLIKDKRVLTPLVQSLRNPDYMIADNAERSLVALTGQTFDYDADAWTKWIEQTPDPFANAGAAVTSRPAEGDWWNQQQRVWRKAIKLSID